MTREMFVRNISGWGVYPVVRALFILFGSAVMCLTPAFAQDDARLIETAKLGAVFALTGPAALYSPTIINALEMATEDANAQSGPKIEIDLQDDRSNRNDAVNVYQKFIQRDGVLLIFGPLLGTQAFAAGPVAQQAKTPVMLTSVATPGVTDIGNNIFRTAVESATIIPSTVKVAVEKFGIRKAALIYTNDDQFSIGEYNAYKAALEDFGVEIVGSETLRTGDVDFSPQLTKLKESNPEVIVISSQGEESVGIMIQARKLGLENVRFLGGNAFNSSGMIREAGEAMEGALSATPWFASTDNTDPKMLTFIEEYSKRYGSEPDWLAAQTYDAVHLVRQAIVDAKINKDDEVASARIKLRDALAAIKSYNGVMGTITFDASRNPIVQGVVIKVEGGKHVLFN